MVMKIYVISLSVSPGLALDFNDFNPINQLKNFKNSYNTAKYASTKALGVQIECAIHPKECKFPFTLEGDSGRIYEQCLPKDGGEKWWCPNKEGGPDVDCEPNQHAHTCIDLNKKAGVDHAEMRPVFLIPGFTSTKLYVKYTNGIDPECGEYFPDGKQVYPPVEIADDQNGLFLEMLEQVTITLDRKMDDKMKCFAKLMKLEHLGGEIYKNENEGIHVYADHAAENGFGEGVPILMNDVKQHFESIGYNKEGKKNFRSVPYDWRHSPAGLEANHGYFTYLKEQIEDEVRKSGGKPAVLIGYSYGGLVASAFLEFIMTPKEKDGKMLWRKEDGKRWLETNIDSFVPMATPLLGSVDPIAFIHQEWLTRNEEGMTDTDSLRNAIVDALRSWPGIHALLPTGGDTVWSTDTIIKYETTRFRNMFSSDENDNQKSDDELNVRQYLTNADKFLPGYDGRTAYPSEKELQPPPVKVYCLFHSGNPTATRFNFVAGSYDDETDYAADRLSRTKGIETENQGDTTVHIRSSGYPCWLWKKKKAELKKADDVILRLYQNQKQGQYDDVLYDTTHLGSLYNKDLLADLLAITASTKRTSLKDRLDTETRTFFETLDERRNRGGLTRLRRLMGNLKQTTIDLEHGE